ncbi:esterase [Massilia solisilvae]|uniref:Esterase n=1 Tax=Massilia solisilvae TaxID=1811225 RepID=A0ABT2BEJ9_9BURK|nr:esterase [Massilia solisilvae]MCS0606841.1 esterase [Massilia solisilvae]
MKPLRWLLGAALIPAAVLAADGTPLKGDIYIRGAFNGWGLDNVMAWRGNGIYQADILVNPGYHAFKVGSRDWGAEWVIDPAASVAVEPGKPYRMDTHPGPEDYLFVKQTSTWRFTVDVSDPARPVLRVARVEGPAPVSGADPHAGHTAVSMDFSTWDGKRETARFSADDPAAPLRTYTQSTTMQLRDPGPQHVRYRESASLPRVRSGNLAFDGLFALAGAEMLQDSVHEIRDGNYNGNAPIPCECFETGEKWHYVWTRDLSYAADLGLAMLDPRRVRNSLEFKLSGWRPGVTRAPHVAGGSDGLQVVQDTGSGGSWPVSTDRVTWAYAAEKVLLTLPPAERAAFARTALTALSNTIDNDRLAAFDKATGLYTGEESFLDWRDQTYAAWIPADLASMASAKALSTNVGHYKALTLAAQLAREQGDMSRAGRYESWARELKQSINRRLWLNDAGMYSSLTAGHFDGAPMHKFDWLGQALAIDTGVAGAARARSIVASYPHGPMGAPVIWPQQQGMPVYHNRAIWPFVTAYGLRAAARTGNVSVADAAYATLMRGAALNLSNMENLEWLSGQPLLLDEQHPSLIGPVISSRRQLWSVGAYLGMVIEDIFGVHLAANGIEIKPFITARLRRDAFGESSLATLDNLRIRGKALTVRLHLPRAEQGNGYYRVALIALDGQPARAAIAWQELKDGSTIDVEFGPLVAGEQAIRRVNANPYEEDRAVFAPREPQIARVERTPAGKPVLHIADGGNTDARYNVYRDGKLVAAAIASAAWTGDRTGATGCYAVEAVYADTNNYSHHGIPRCIGAAIEVPVTDARVSSNVPRATPSQRFPQPHIQDWGSFGDRFAVDAIRIGQTGQYAVQVRYHNSANQVNLGISGGVKWLALKDASGRVVAGGVVQLPHARIEKADTPTVYSTPIAATLTPGSYRLELSDFYNMSYLRSNSGFSAAGGVEGPSNRFDIYGVRLLRVR